MNNILECRKIVKTFHDGSRELKVLRGIDLAIHEGEILAISGASGAGKSTLLHILGTLDKPTSGELLIRGDELADLGRRTINRIRNEEIGFVFQFYHLLPEFTALENVMMPALCKGKHRAECRVRAEELLAKVGLAERMTHKPGQLSGGEEQRVAIARALVSDPQILVADEPTGDLDAPSAKNILELLERLNEELGKTILMVTHDARAAAHAQTTLRLDKGKLIGPGAGPQEDVHATG